MRAPAGLYSVRVGMRRCGSDPAVRTGARQSPIRELPLNARIVRHRKENSAAAGAADEENTADGDRPCRSPRVDVPLRAKHAVTCLLLDHQRSAPTDAAPSTPRHPASVVDSSNSVDLAVSHWSCQFPAASFAPSDQTENADKKSCACAVASTGDASETTSPDVTSPPERLAVDWSSTSSEYYTPPTRRTTTSVAASHSTTTRFCDAASQTAPPGAGHPCSTDVETARPDRPCDDSVATASSTFTRICDAQSLQRDAGVKSAEVQTTTTRWLSDSEQSTLVADGAVATRPGETVDTEAVQSANFRSPRPSCAVESEPKLQSVDRQQNGGVATPENTASGLEHSASGPFTASATITVFCNTTSTVDADVHPADVQWTPLSCPENSNVVSGSQTITLASGTTSSTFRTTVPTPEVVAEHWSLLERSRLVAAGRSTQPAAPVCDRTPSAGATTIVCHTNTGANKNRGRDFDVRCPAAAAAAGAAGLDRDGRLGCPVGIIQVDRRHSSPSVRTSDQQGPRQTPAAAVDRRRSSTSALGGTAPARRPRYRRPAVERIGPQSLIDMGGPTTAAAARHRDPAAPARRAPVPITGRPSRAPPPCQSYVRIWRRRIATYEAFISRCQTSTATGARTCQL